MPNAATPTAADALRTAIESEANAKSAHDQAAAAVRTTQAARDALIDDAAAGKGVMAQTVRAAEEAIRAAEIDAEIAARIHTAAVTRREEAQKACWEAEAVELQNEVLSATDARIAAAVAVDEAFSAFKKVIEAHKVAGTRLRAAQAAARLFNSNREARRATNAALRAQIAIEGPVDPVVRWFSTNPPPDLLAAVYVGGNPDMRTYIESVAVFDSRHLGRPLTRPAA